MTRLSLLRTLTFLSECVAQSQRPPSRFDPVSFTVLLPRCRRAQPADKGLLFLRPNGTAQSTRQEAWVLLFRTGSFQASRELWLSQFGRPSVSNLGSAQTSGRESAVNFGGRGKGKCWEGGGLTSLYGRMGRYPGAWLLEPCVSVSPVTILLLGTFSYSQMEVNSADTFSPLNDSTSTSQ